MKLKSIFVAVLFAVCTAAAAQGTFTFSNGRTITYREAQGQDRPYPFDLEEALPQAPDGYFPFYIEHYGRHGSRFAYSNVYYDTFRKALSQAEAKGVLTPLGASVKKDFDSHYPLYHNRMGDLTDAGWNQQLRLGREMVQNYPCIFTRSDASVFALSSESRRAMMSMSGFCLGMAQAAPYVSIREDQGNVVLYATHPRSPNNPFKEHVVDDKFPFEESLEAFHERKTGFCPQVLESLFTDPDAALEGIGKDEFMRKLYVLAVGMNSLNPEDRTDFSSFFSGDDIARMWEVDNYQRFREYYKYMKKLVPVLRDIVNDADDAIASSRYGARLRFGHDHVILPLLSLLHLNGYSKMAATTDEISAIFGNIDCPMAGNIQIVLYRSQDGGDVLVNIRLNGRNATVDGLGSVCPGFYRWSDYRTVLATLPERP